MLILRGLYRRKPLPLPCPTLWEKGDKKTGLSGRCLLRPLYPPLPQLRGGGRMQEPSPSLPKP